MFLWIGRGGMRGQTLLRDESHRMMPFTRVCGVNVRIDHSNKTSSFVCMLVIFFGFTDNLSKYFWFHVGLE
jgi:hypothetical protein